MPYILLQIVAVPLLAACASEADYREDVEGWIGAREADLVASSWGQPDQIHDVIGGERILTYSKTSESGGGGGMAILPAITIGSSGSGVSFSTVTGGGVDDSERYCETSFTVENEIITDVTFHGPGCKS